MVTDETDLPTPRTTLASRYVRVLLTCWSCRHRADADLPALVAAGHGDVPLVRLRWRWRWRCAHCRSGHINMICTSRDRVAVASVGERRRNRPEGFVKGGAAEALP